MMLPRQIRRALVIITAVVATAGLAVATTIAADHRVEIAGLEFVPGEITVAVARTGDPDCAAHGNAQRRSGTGRRRRDDRRAAGR